MSVHSVRHLPSFQEYVEEHQPKRARQEEAKEEVPQDPLPIDLISATITSDLSDRLSSIDCVNNITSANPDLLFQIALYTKEDFLAFFPQSDNLGFTNALLILYTTSLRNSRYYSSTCYLEENIESLMDLSKQESMQNLIRQAQNFTSGDPQECMKLLTQIDKTLGLFCYVDSGADQRIRNLYRHARKTDDRFFVNCPRYFPLFSANLRICAHERSQLQGLRRGLLACISQERPEPAVLSRRDQILHYEAIPLYEAGVEFLRDCLKLTLKQKPLPEDLKEAINRASEIKEFGYLNFKNLRKKRDPILPDEFVWHVFMNYADKEICDFMTRFINHLGEDEFNLLADSLKPPNKQRIILDALKHYFPQATFPSLKNWIG